MKVLLFIFFLIISLNVFSQKNIDINKFSVELNGGEIFTKTTHDLTNSFINIFNIKNYYPYLNYFYPYKGIVNLNLLLYYPLTKIFDLSINQNYARLSNNDLNNRTTLHLTSFNINSCIYRKNKFNIKVSSGVGIEIIHIKSLNDFYSFRNNICGIPIKAIISTNYKLSEKLYLTFNFDFIYSFFFYNKYLDLNPGYYQASFNSINIGLCYSFGKEEN